MGDQQARQLDHDVEDIYIMLATISGIAQRQANRLEEIAETQAEHSATLTEHTAKLDEIVRLLTDR